MAAISAANSAEFLWIHPLDDRFIGQINNTPRCAVNLKTGDTVSFVKRNCRLDAHGCRRDERQL